MTLPGSGALTWTSIQSEMGGSNPIGLNEYYVNGSIVPNSNRNINIPLSGAIDADGFHGAQGFSGAYVIFTATTTGGKIPRIGLQSTDTANPRAWTNTQGMPSNRPNFNKKCVCHFYYMEIGVTYFSMIHPGGPSTFVPSTSPNNSAGPPGDMALTTGQGITPLNAQTGSVNGGFMRGSNTNTYSNPATFPFVAGTTYNGFWY